MNHRLDQDKRYKVKVSKLKYLTGSSQMNFKFNEIINKTQQFEDPFIVATSSANMFQL